ncbi:uncharacterized protein V1518DRAFT_411472 [Limtongia smithiae]|uniref:uncharacterized protein n=1 Tax=Limtongia smithiae TaxID=1125753 RepID=UPI0034CF0D7A
MRTRSGCMIGHDKGAPECILLFICLLSACCNCAARWPEGSAGDKTCKIVRRSLATVRWGGALGVRDQSSTREREEEAERDDC